MAITVEQAMKLDAFKKCRLLTGQTGLQNEILWVNILEILDDLSHIESGEFLITTAHGFTRQSREQQQTMVKHFANRKMAALAIQTGHYIDEIPDSLVTIFQKQGIPLIEIPAEVSFKSMTRSLMHTLLHSESDSTGYPIMNHRSTLYLEHSQKIKALWYKLAEGDRPEDIHRDLLETALKETRVYRIAMIGARHQDTQNFHIPVKTPEKLQHKIEQALFQVMRHRRIPFLAGPAENNLALLLQPSRSDPADSIFPILSARRILEELRQIYPRLTITMGLSSVYHQLNDFKNALNESSKALQVAAMQLQNDHGFTTYSGLKLYRLILEIEDVEVLRTIHNQTIAPLVDYDQRTGGALVETLQMFMRYLNIKTAAKILFIHRHTMKYRLNQIRSLTGCNPEKPSGIFALNEGLAVHHYLKACGLLEQSSVD